jgi:3-phosphoglycerate kinase
MKYLRDVEKLSGVRVLVRVDFNVPVKDGKVLDDFRIRKILPTLAYLQSKKAKIILVSHIEPAPWDKKEGKVSLDPVCLHLAKIGVRCTFLKNYRDAREAIEKLEDGEILLLENLRMNEGETKNDRNFARELASLADIYVNEAFAVSHRAHASVSAVTEFIPSYGGLLFEQEIKHLSSAFNPDHPFLFILSGAKFETKLPLIEKFMGIADKVFVGGALANNFFKEMGKDIGTSLVSPQNFNLSRYFKNPKLLLPVDSVWVDGAIYDAGEQTMKMLADEISKAKYILWNGPLGAYENGYKQPTLDLAHMIARATSHGSKSILGGGDTLAAIAALGTENTYTFVSTGGGAMLEYLAKGTLPAVEALEKSKA